MIRRYSVKTIRLLLKILPVSFWLILIFAFDKPYIAVLTLLSAFIHELGHIIAFIRFSKGYRFFGVSSGLRLSADTSLSYREELAVALAGPSANLVTFLMLSPFIFLGSYPYAAVFGAINVFTALSNLVPVDGYDGYRVLKCLIDQRSRSAFCSEILRAVSLLLTAAISLLSLYLIRSFDGGYWIFFIFLASLIKAISKDRAVLLGKRD